MSLNIREMQMKNHDEVAVCIDENSYSLKNLTKPSADKNIKL